MADTTDHVDTGNTPEQLTICPKLQRSLLQTGIR